MSHSYGGPPSDPYHGAPGSGSSGASHGQPPYGQHLGQPHGHETYPTEHRDPNPQGNGYGAGPGYSQAPGYGHDYGQGYPQGQPGYAQAASGHGQPFGAPAQPGGVPDPYAYNGAAARPGVLELRPQDVGDVFSVSWRTVTKRFWTTAGLLLLPGAAALLLVGIYVWLLASNGVFDRDYQTGDQIAREAPGVITFGVFFLILFYIVAIAATTGLTHVFSQAVLGERPGVMACFAVGFRRMWSVLGSSLLLGLGMIPVFVVLAVIGAATGTFDTTTQTALDGTTTTTTNGNPAFFLFYLATVIAVYAVMVRFAFTPTIAVVEKAGPLQSLRRSWKLTKGRFWRTLGILILVMMAIWAATVAFTLVGALFAALVGGPAFSAEGDLTSGQTAALVAAIAVLVVILFIPTMFTQPFMMNALGTLYVDARIRDKNFAADIARAAGTTRRPGF